MFVIDRIPRRLNSFFATVEHLFEKRQWPHFQALVLVYALAHGRRNIAHIQLRINKGTSCTKWKEIAADR